jgi:hypothetical protein
MGLDHAAGTSDMLGSYDNYNSYSGRRGGSARGRRGSMRGGFIEGRGGRGRGRNLSWTREGYQQPGSTDGAGGSFGGQGRSGAVRGGRGRSSGAQGLGRGGQQWMPPPRPPSLLEKLLNQDIRWGQCLAGGGRLGGAVPGVLRQGR